MSSIEQFIKELNGLYEDLYETVDAYVAAKMDMVHCEHNMDMFLKEIELKKVKINKAVGLEKTFNE